MSIHHSRSYEKSKAVTNSGVQIILFLMILCPILDDNAEASSTVRIYSETRINGKVVEHIDKTVEGNTSASISIRSINSDNSNTMQSNVKRSYVAGTSSSDVSSMFVDLQRPGTNGRPEVIPSRDLMRSIINFLKHVIALF